MCTKEVITEVAQKIQKWYGMLHYLHVHYVQAQLHYTHMHVMVDLFLQSVMSFN